MSAKRNKNNSKKKIFPKKKEQDLTGVRQWRTLNQVREIKETRAYRKTVDRLLNPDEQANLLDTLRTLPDSGDIIPGTGGCRKLRWTVENKGKRGGSRIIYYWYQGDGIIFLLLAYKKGDQKDLTMKQKKALRKLVKGS